MPIQDRVFEAQTFPQAFPLEQFHRPVLLAPHPDDEVFGCAGLLALWAQRGVQARVVVLTEGQAQGEGAQRQAESQAAAAVLGGYALDFWQLPDRDVRCTPELQQRIAAYVQAHQADVLLVPALHEPHPDHQACALAALWSLVQLPQAVDLCFYESGTALVHCSHLVDITSVQAQKMQAMQAFGSQEEVQPYSSRIAALNHFRAITLGPQVQAAEGLQWLPLAQQGWSALLPALDPLFLHQRGQAIVPQDLPLVSVLIRTMGDPRLEQAIASVCAQNYPQLELILAAATPDLLPPAWLSVLSRQADWLACTEQPGFIAAGNRALRHARGQYFLVLEESSFLPPGHLTELVTLLREQPSMRAASMTPQFQQLHALLFASTLFHQDGCAWRNAVARESDEDFWLQICLHTRLVQPSGPAFDLPDWQQRYNQSQQELMIAQSQLTQIHNSRAWRWVQKLRDIQKRLVSKGGV